MSSLSIKLFGPVALIALLHVSSCTTTNQRPEVNAPTKSQPQLEERAASLSRKKEAVEKFFSPMTVREGDWLDSQKEAGETFEQYIASDPTLPTPQRRTIYIQPIGTFDQKQRQAIRLTAEYIGAFYDLPVKLNADRALGNVPADKTRRIAYRNNLQIRTNYFLADVLPKMLPDDAAALVAFTNYDLYPEETWAFVFGQATFSERVGVWSLYRFGDPATGKTDAKLLLDRTLKVAVHEIGHMFSMKHCVKYECLMSGTNHLAETDRRPLDNCPECMAKVAWAMNYDPVSRYLDLAAFWEKQARVDEARKFLEKAKAIE
jgi:archaemetzincin